MGLIEQRRKILLNTPHIEELSTNTFQTNMIAPMKKCEVQFLPMQSGTGDPSPDNIRPITGYNNITVRQSGKNLFNPSSFNTESNPLTLDNDPTSPNYGFYGGSVTAWSNNYKTSVSDYGVSDFALDVEQLTISAIVKSTDGGNFNFRFYFIYSDGTIDYNGGNITATGTEKRVSRTSKSDKTVVGYYISSSSSTSNRKGLIKDVQVEIGPETSFEPYQSLNTYTTNLGVSEIYGGTADLVTGVLTITHNIVVIDGSENPAIFPWQLNNAASGWIKALYRRLPYENIHPNYHSTPVGYYCDKAKPMTIPELRTLSEYGFGAYDNNSYGIILLMKIEDVGNTLESLNAYLTQNPFTIVYPLLNPVTYQLTPTQIKALLNGNTFLTDDGKIVKVNYWKH